RRPRRALAAGGGRGGPCRRAGAGRSVRGGTWRLHFKPLRGHVELLWVWSRRTDRAQAPRLVCRRSGDRPGAAGSDARRRLARGGAGARGPRLWRRSGKARRMSLPAAATLWASPPVPAIILDERDRAIDVNPAAELFLNASTRALRGQPVFDRLAIAAPLEEVFARVRANQSSLYINDVDVGTGERAPVICNL